MKACKIVHVMDGEMYRPIIMVAVKAFQLKGIMGYISVKNQCKKKGFRHFHHYPRIEDNLPFKMQMKGSSLGFGRIYYLKIKEP